MKTRCWRPRQKPPVLTADDVCRDELSIVKRLEERYGHGSGRHGGGDRRQMHTTGCAASNPLQAFEVKQEPLTPRQSPQPSQERQLHSQQGNFKEADTFLLTHGTVKFEDNSEICGTNVQKAHSTFDTNNSLWFGRTSSRNSDESLAFSPFQRAGIKRNYASHLQNESPFMLETGGGFLSSSACSLLPSASACGQLLHRWRPREEVFMERSLQHFVKTKKMRETSSQQSKWAMYDESDNVSTNSKVQSPFEPSRHSSTVISGENDMKVCKQSPFDQTPSCQPTFGQRNCVDKDSECVADKLSSWKDSPLSSNQDCFVPSVFIDRNETVRAKPNTEQREGVRFPSTVFSMFQLSRTQNTSGSVQDKDYFMPGNGKRKGATGPEQITEESENPEYARILNTAGQNKLGDTSLPLITNCTDGAQLGQKRTENQVLPKSLVQHSNNSTDSLSSPSMCQEEGFSLPFDLTQKNAVRNAMSAGQCSLKMLEDTTRCVPRQKHTPTKEKKTHSGNLRKVRKNNNVDDARGTSNTAPKQNHAQESAQSSSRSRIQEMLKTFPAGAEDRTDQCEDPFPAPRNDTPPATTVTRKPRSAVTDVTDLTRDERSQLQSQLTQCIQCAWMVLFNDKTASSVWTVQMLKPQAVKGILLHADKQTYLLPLASSADVLKWTRSVFCCLLEAKKPVKIATNTKHLVTVLVKEFHIGSHRDVFGWPFEDPYIAGWLLQPDSPPQTLQDLCALAGLDFHPAGSLDDQLHTELKTVLRVMEKLRALLTEQRLWQLFHSVEMPLTPLLAVMEQQAIRIHVETFVRYSEILKKKLVRLEQKSHELAGHPFSINSTQQLRQLLYEELKLDQQLPSHSKVSLTAATHSKSTSEPMLRQLMNVHPLPGVILEYRQLLKLKSTYIDGIVEAMEGGELCTHWDQMAAATGRLTSTHPNLQAIPKVPTTISDFEDTYIVGAEPKAVEIFAREPYICNEGNVFLAADFQQIELRLLAHLTDDPKLKEVFLTKNTTDVFIQLTSQWLGKSPGEVTTRDREQTKRVVYSVMYGVGKDRLAEYLKVCPSRAKDIMDSFLVTFPAIQAFTRRCVDYARHHGYTESVMGRRQWVPRVNHCTPQLRAQAERQAVNFCVQGSAADVCKCAMLKVEQALRKRPHLKARLLINIHDELLWELPADQLQETCGVIRQVMEDSALCQPILPALRVPLTVTLTSGSSWAHLKPCQV